MIIFIIIKIIATLIAAYICKGYIRRVRQGGSPVIGLLMGIIFLIAIWSNP